MSDEKFLERWSRRKREAARNASSQSTSPPLDDPPHDSFAKPPVSPQPAPGEVKTLPPVDAIDGNTDIRGFLAEGVPASLSRVALRRAWTSDPGIRDFVGLSENAWDFTAPDGVPGFGPLSAKDVRRLLARADEIAPSHAALEAEGKIAAEAPPEEVAETDAAARERPNDANSSATADPGRAEIESSPPSARHHGGALPK